MVKSRLSHLQLITYSELYSTSMNKLSILLSAAFVVVISGCKQREPDNLVLVKGGFFLNATSNLYKEDVTIPDFYIGKYEVTQKEWTELMGDNPSQFPGENLPVEMVTWYSCVEYCNKRSLREGLTPYYNISEDKDPNNKMDLDSVKWTVTIDRNANGYRLPTEVEWEYAAGGGQESNSFIYSGSNDIGEVAWYWRNSGDTVLTGAWNWTMLENNHCKTKPVGRKKPNELGLYDMSGNVREWCEDWYEDSETDSGFTRVQRGGGWIGSEYRCESSNRHSFEANGKGPDQGFRVCRSK